MSDTTTTTLSAVEGSVPTPPPPPGHIGGGRFAALAFLVLVAVPPLAYAAGVRPASAENRAATPAPAVADVAALEPDALAQLSDHLVDALPGRDVAVRADAWVDLEVFGTSPTRDVLLGRDDWLFLRATLEGHCRSDAQVEALGGELARAAGVVGSTGRELHTLIAPDKATIHPERLPDGPASDGCGQAFGAQVRRLLEPDPPHGYLPFWSQVEELRDRAGAPIYFASDTHWLTEASAVMVEAIVGAFDRSLFATAVPRRREPASFTGDLSLLTGLHRTETERPLVFDRRGVSWDLRRGDDLPREVPDDVPPIDVSVLSATGGPVVPDRVTFLHDSFAYMTRPQLAPFFAELVMIRKHAPSSRWVGAILRSSERIVFEVVERDAWARIVEDHLVGSLAAALREDLAVDEQQLVADDDGWAAVSLREGDVVVVPLVIEGRADTPYVLEVRRPGSATWSRLSSQRETSPGEELVFDTAGLDAPADLPLGAVEVRLLAPDGATLNPTRIERVATR